MRALVVYESMYGNTRHIADAIAEGLRFSMRTEVMVARDAGNVDLDSVDLVVVGAPTHAWGLSSPRTREAATIDAAKHPDHLLDAAAPGDGVREWLHDVRRHRACRGVGFDTRLVKPKLFTGSAGRAIERGLHRAGFTTFAKTHSFAVTDMTGPPASGELERAAQWGEAMGRAVTRTVGSEVLLSGVSGRGLPRDAGRILA